jgi:hypothetical protein
MFDFGLFKLNCISAGVAAGLLLPKSSKKTALSAASIIFGFTLIPLMLKFISTIASYEHKEDF